MTAETVRDLWRLLTSTSPVAERISATPARAAAESAPESAHTLWDVLAWHVRAHPQRPHLILLTDTGADETLDHTTLAHAAETIGAGLQERGVRPGQTVAIMRPTGRDYFASFFGVLAAGAIPVPVYPPARATQIEDHLRRHARILVNARGGAHHRARSAPAGAPADAGARTRLHRHRRRTGRRRWRLRLTATPWRAHGLEHLPAGPSIIVANHASYIDGIVLTAALPGVFSFVAKREFTARLIPRLFLRHIGAEFVERIETLRGVEDARSLARAARAEILRACGEPDSSGATPD